MLCGEFLFVREGIPMAVKGSGVVASTIDPQMKTPESTSPIDPRAGRAKRTQTKYPDHPGMRSRIGEVSGIVGHGPDGAPDASSPNPLDPSPTDKILRRQPQVLKSSWGMKDANGQSINGNLGHEVLTEAANLGR
jgi:hypothetical protein